MRMPFPYFNGLAVGLACARASPTLSPTLSPDRAASRPLALELAGEEGAPEDHPYGARDATVNGAIEASMSRASGATGVARVIERRLQILRGGWGLRVPACGQSGAWAQGASYRSWPTPVREMRSAPTAFAATSPARPKSASSGSYWRQDPCRRRSCTTC